MMNTVWRRGTGVGVWVGASVGGELGCRVGVGDRVWVGCGADGVGRAGRTVGVGVTLVGELQEARATQMKTNPTNSRIRITLLNKRPAALA